MTLIVDQVTKEYPIRDGALRILDGVDLQLQPGENLAIVGPSGSGKSTLLSVIGTLELPTWGSVTLDGEKASDLNERQLAQWRRRKIGFIFQDHHLLQQCNVLENVLVPTIGQPGRISSDEAKRYDERARELLDRVGMSDRLEHRPSELSGGERQRVAICRALIFQPQLLLADEPTGNLDRDTSSEVADLLLDLQRERGMMMLVVTHSEQLAARLDRRMLLNAGKLEEMG